EVVHTEGSIDSVGGLAGLKRWLSQRRGALAPAAREFGLPAPRGVLLLGVPGSGKSLVARSVAASWQLPLLRLDVGRLFGSLLGESERNLRRALAVAEAASPVVLWIDEIEKGFAGSESSGRTDGGAA